MKVRTLKTIAIYSFANYLYVGINSICNIFVSRILGPSSTGVINYFNAISSNFDTIVYGTIRSSIEREVPLMNNEDAKNYVASCLTFNALLTVLVSLVYAAIALNSDNSVVQFSAISVLFLNAVKSFSDFYRIWNKALNRILFISKIMIFSALLLPFVVIVFTIYYNLEGFWVGRFLFQVVLFVLYARLCKEYFKMHSFNRTVLKKIISSGGVIVLFSVYVSLMQTVDKYVVKASLGFEQLGYYGIGTMCFSMLMLLPNSIVGSVFPKFVSMLNANLRNEILKYTFYLEIMSIVLLVIVYYITPVVINYLLPEYANSIPVVRIFLVAFVLYSVCQVKYMDIVRKKKMSVLIKYSVLSLLVTFLLYIVAYLKKWGISEIAWVSVIGFLLLNWIINYSWAKIYNFNFKYFVLLLLDSILILVSVVPFYIVGMPFLLALLYFLLLYLFTIYIQSIIINILRRCS